ncbi:unannotated protein [freshwater metagenome]|uniref:Unannotated protein n=1 Tax=freshwater metagenome TaxID=449393 RepID=A0A6J6I0I7_9ZZZZ
MCGVGVASPIDRQRSQRPDRRIHYWSWSLGSDVGHPCSTPVGFVHIYVCHNHFAWRHSRLHCLRTVSRHHFVVCRHCTLGQRHILWCSDSLRSSCSHSSVCNVTWRSFTVANNSRYHVPHCPRLCGHCLASSKRSQHSVHKFSSS